VRSVNSEISRVAALTTAQTPCAFIDVYATLAARGVIDSSGQWIGAADPMVGSDSNMSFTRVQGSATLSEGAAVAVVTTGTAQTPSTISMTGYTTANYTSNSAWWRDTIYTLLGYDQEILTQVSNNAFGFIALATMLADSVVIKASYSSVGVGARNCYAYLADSTGVQIGKRIDFTPSTSITTHTLTGFQASLTKSRTYYLIVGYDAFSVTDLAKYGIPSGRYDQSFTLNIYAVNGLTGVWYIPTGTGIGFSMGGYEGYTTSGSLVRQIDLGVLPTTDGIVSFIDVVPSGTVQTVTLYYTDNAAHITHTTLTSWTLHGIVSSGGVIGTHRYWRAKVDMTSTAAHDEAPSIAKIDLSYKDTPVTLGTHKEVLETENSGYSLPFVLPLVPGRSTYERLVIGSQSIESISTKSAQMNPKLTTSMIGKFTAKLMPDSIVVDMMSKKLRGKLAEVRVGFVINNKHVTDRFYSGIVSDISWSGSSYTLTITDDLDIVDVQIPREKAGLAWSASTTYAVGDIVVYGTASWESNVAGNIGITPGTDPAKWINNGTVWASITYAATHLADICRDILINHVNIQSQRIDFSSIDAVKLLYPSMIGSSRVITKPVNALEALSELAWLLGSQWVMRDGKLALIPEPTGTAVGTITDIDIVNVNYRRGWSDLKNECLIMSGYSGDGEGQEQFLQSYVYASTTSISDYEMVGLEVFNDKWGVSEAQLIARAERYVTRWQNGRRVVTFDASMRLIRFEPGDIVTFKSKAMPPNDTGDVKCIVVGQDIDWLNQKMKFTLMEV